MDKALIIFVRNAEKGKVKTRLAATIGDDHALEVYEFLLAHTAAVAGAAGVPVYVYYAESISENDLWSRPPFIKKRQSGEGLGDRMKDAFDQVFKAGFSNVVIIGSDCYELSGSIIGEAFDLLRDHDLAMGPAMDGGYYLLGMKRLHKELFAGKNWSTDSVFAQTMEDARICQLSVALLPLLSDVDEEKDITFSWR